MIRGATTINLDSKNRLAIPSRYRSSIMESCEGHLVVTVNNTQEHCLWLYLIDEWEKIEKKIVDLPSFDPSHIELKRFVLGHATDVEMDANGRILLPSNLREFALMKKSVELVGQGNKFEIWGSELWQQRRSHWLQKDMDLQNISVELQQLTL